MSLQRDRNQGAGHPPEELYLVTRTAHALAHCRASHVHTCVTRVLASQQEAGPAL